MHIQKPLTLITSIVSTLTLTCAALFASASYAANAELGQIVVTATRQETRSNDLLSDVTVIERSDIERAGQSTITDLLARQPGVQTVSNGGPGTNTNFYIRGARPDQTKILIDGVPINSIDTSGSPLRFVPLADVERIEILRGPAATLYGADAIGGVIQIFTRRGEPGLRTNAFVGAGSYNTRQGAFGVSGGNEQWSFRVGANQQSADNFSARRNATNKDRDLDPYRNTGSSAALSFQPTKGHEVTASLLNADGLVHYDSTTGTGNFDSRNLFKTEVFNLATKNQITDAWKSTLSYGSSFDEQTNYSSTSQSGSKLQTRGEQFFWQNDVRLPLGSGLLMLEHTEQEAFPESRFGKAQRATNSKLVGWNGHWQSHIWQISARREEHSRFGTKNTGALGYGYQITSEIRASAAIASAFKAPSLYQLYVPVNGNPNLKPEQANNRELSLVWNRNANRISLTVYSNRIRDLINVPSDTQPYGNIARAKFDGTTISYAGHVSQWALNANLDFLHAINEDTGLRLDRRANEKLTLTALRAFGQWEIGGETVSVGPRFNTSSSTNNLTGGMGGYTLLNATARYALAKDWSLEMRADNLGDKYYETALGYGTAGQSFFAGVRYSPK